MESQRKYYYVAKTEKGQIRKGEIQAENLEKAQKEVESQGLITLSIEEAEGWRYSLSSTIHRVKAGEKALFSRELSTMVRAGYPLADALKVISSQTKNRYLRSVIDEITTDIESGFSLATAMAKHGDIFDRVYIAVVRAGESSGNLGDVLRDIAQEQERDYRFNVRLRNAMLYPLFILIAMIVIGALMMTRVIPQLSEIFADSGIALPWTTRAVIATSNFLSVYWWVVVILIIIIFFLFRIYLRSPAGNYVWSGITLKIPVFGPLIEKASMARMARTFGVLAKTGIPLLEAINISAETMSNEVFRRGLKKAASEVERGVPFSVPILKNNAFPIMIGQMISVGEQTGKIDEVFVHISKHYEDETSRQLKTVTSLTEPLTIIVLGILVAILVFAIIVPIYNMVDVV